LTLGRFAISGIRVFQSFSGVSEGDRLHFTGCKKMLWVMLVRVRASTSVVPLYEHAQFFLSAEGLRAAKRSATKKAFLCSDLGLRSGLRQQGIKQCSQYSGPTEVDALTQITFHSHISHPRIAEPQSPRG
jgi:hypothetical protein